MWRSVIAPSPMERPTATREPHVEAQSALDDIAEAPATKVRRRVNTWVDRFVCTSLIRMG